MPDDRQGHGFPETAQPFLYGPAGGTSPAGLNGRGAGVAPPPAEDALKQAYEKGALEAVAGARTDFERALAEIRSQISAALLSFSKDRADYFARVEVEVVRLSLSIARKILHRESQIDPAVLSGVVHVALQRLGADTRVRLRAHPDDARFWADYFRQTKDAYPTVEVVGDAALPAGHCSLETEFGSTEISLDTQLKEIEQGFFDLLEQRPKGGE